jgi:uncharacterized membrane protein YbhN (UPF0104 family)
MAVAEGTARRLISDAVLRVAAHPMLLRLGVSVLLLAWLARAVDGDVLATVASVSWPIALAAFALMLVSQLVGALRLRGLLAAQAIPLSYRESATLTLVSNFANNFLPGTVGGDIVKVLLIGRRNDGWAAVTAAVLVDRLVNLGAMLVLLPLAATVPSLRADPLTLLVLLALGAAPLGLLVVLWLGRRGPVPPPGPLTARTLVPWARRGVTQVLLALRRGLFSPAGLALALVLSLIVVQSAIVATWLLVVDLGVPIGLIAWTGIVCLVYCATLVPIALNGLGLQEITIVHLMVVAGATPPQALALAILFRLLSLSSTLPGALLMLLRPSVK